VRVANTKSHLRSPECVGFILRTEGGTPFVAVELETSAREGGIFAPEGVGWILELAIK
jgi:hypothetical protein